MKLLVGSRRRRHDEPLRQARAHLFGQRQRVQDVLAQRLGQRTNPTVNVRDRLAEDDVIEARAGDRGEV